MRKEDDGEKKRKEKKRKKNTSLVATNVIASRPPERRLTGTPTACAKSVLDKACAIKKLVFDSRFAHVSASIHWIFKICVPTPHDIYVWGTHKNFEDLWFSFFSVILQKLKTYNKADDILLEVLIDKSE